MLKLSEAGIVERLRSGEPFEATLLDGSFSLKIEEYAPVICSAVHAGGNFRSSLQTYCALNEQERYYEEDPHTDELIQSMPITIVGHDSRYAYDLNRPLARCIYSKAWGKDVWGKKLPVKERRLSTERHRAFYRILDVLVEVIEERYGACLVLDLHSYNFQRIPGDTPDFNLGVEQIDMDRWAGVVSRLQKNLSRIRVQEQTTRAAVDEVFYGRGYMISHINSRFENTLVIPMEVKKIFMDESTGTLYPLVLSELKQGLKQSYSDTAAYFARQFTRQKKTRRSDILSSQLDSALLKVDKKLYRLAKGLETLQYINPTNLLQERKRFLARRGNYIPCFRYRPLDIDPYQFREQLYRLPVDEIRDPGIQQLYRDVVDGLAAKIDLLVNAGQPEFIYSSLKYYGEPSVVDERNARFLLHARQFESEEEPSIDAEELGRRFKLQAQMQQMQCRIEVSSKLVAAAMVSNRKKTVYINKSTLMSERQAAALMHHELGVHMATTLNAISQPLKVFSLGLPGNTMTQEGLAILNEYQSGNMLLSRMQVLALRVLAVREMLDHGDFRHTFSYLREEQGLSDNDAFQLSTRVHRAGGFTKDYLYLKGVGKALALRRQVSLAPLFVGKTGFDYLPTISEMIDRGILKPPEFLPQGLTEPSPVSEILEYLMGGIESAANKFDVNAREPLAVIRQQSEGVIQAIA
ncbi:flavohemoglobin expression-modulating QEGLA motif protein [Pseudomaricurvus alkylphenolicus]|uniref:flavohemoglobin expression-modulating QEGLA motif protein n=1 Tax=Pseudomaricurvus alkylphenolicus TaxID=1306991 RepID=UPI00141E576A|nr:flavohemoglobin expression-modulating QEGLA motif protein [Pseudomaricurvus alkylphenolicus]NIB41889.1 flavohemoglobin expression-modulating QEGLA motif protein [Pseudomaricurvus alkylphenolicus]